MYPTDSLYEDLLNDDICSAPLIGVAIDWKLGIKKYGLKRVEYQSRTFRLDVSLMPLFNKSLHAKLSGAMLMIKVGFGDKLWLELRDGHTYLDDWRKRRALKKLEKTTKTRSVTSEK